jgi:voltage-gated potassium channel
MFKKHVIEPVIGVLAVVSIILVAVESLTALSTGWLWGLYITDLAICIIFAFEFAGRVIKSEDKGKYFLKHCYELLAMFPAMALYTLGTIPALSMALRSIRLVRVFRAILLLSRIQRLFSKSGGFFQRSNLLAMFGVTFGIVLFSAFIVLACEAGTPNAQITNFNDAVWWSISTVTTVGYGDIVPESGTGRLVGMVLMVVGIGVMTALISQVSAALVETRIKKRTDNNDIRTTIVSEIKNRLDNIEKMSESEVKVMMQMIQALKKGEDKGDA